MDRHEAYSILTAALENHRAMGFTALRAKIGCEETEDVIGSSGVRYALETSIEWADSRQRGVTIRGRISDQNSFRWDPLEERVSVSGAADETS